MESPDRPKPPFWVRWRIDSVIDKRETLVRNTRLLLAVAVLIAAFELPRWIENPRMGWIGLILAALAALTAAWVWLAVRWIDRNGKWMR